MPNFDKHRQASRIIYATHVGLIDGTAAPGYRREDKFDRVLQDWIPGYQHTIPQVHGLWRVNYYICQN